MKSKPHKSGFALVIALSLMAFVLLLLLSITTLVQVETRSAENTKTQTQARMNALLGLQQALGELQQAAGHDQRVTATGSLWTSPAVGTEHLVGVWSSEDGDGDGEPDGDFVRWLVSHDDESAASADEKSDSVNFVTLARPVETDGSGSYTVTNPDFVALVGEGSVAQNDPGQSPQAVVAQKLPILSDSSSAAGNYAWWVGDNGVKATITQADPYAAGLRTGSDFPVNANMLSMQGSNVSALSDFATLDFSDKATVEKLQRSASLSDIELVDSAITSTVLKEHFHDLTTTSLGLQTNTRHGGLKRDLSLLFEMSDADFDDPAGDFLTEMAAVTDQESGGAGVGGFGLVYDNPTVGQAPWVEKSQQALLFKYPISGGASGDGVIYGPSFGMLRDYYRLYKGMVNKDTRPELKEGWVHTYQPSKARVIQNGNGNNSGSRARAYARKYTLGMQGWRKYLSNASPETSQSSASVAKQWGLEKGDAIHSIRPTKGSYTPYLSRVTNVFALTSYKTGNQNAGGFDEYEFDIIWQPHITLHNPYNVRVQSQRMRYTAELRHLRVKDVNCEYTDENGDSQVYKVSYGNGSGEVKENRDVKLEGIFPRSQRDMSFSGSEVILNIPSTQFEPGEVKVFAVKIEQKPTHGNSLTVDLEAVAADDTGGIHLNAASKVDDYKGFIASNGSLRNFIGSDQVEITFKLEKAGAQYIDIWNPELNDWDAMFSVKHGETAQLYGNVKWDDGAKQPYKDTVWTYEDGAIASLVFDDYVKPLSFSEGLGGGGTLVEVADDRKVYPNFMLTNPMAASFHEWGSGTMEEFTWSGVFHSYAESFIKAEEHPRTKIRDGSSRGSWGDDHGSHGPDRSVLFDLPTAPMQSIGQFQHAILHPMPYFAAKAVGNSFPSPFVPYSDTPSVVPPNNISNTNANGIYYTFIKDWPYQGVSKNNEYCFYDFSYLLNDVIWDSYYFSSLAPSQNVVNQLYTQPSDVAGDESSIASSINTVVSDFVNGDAELRNARMTLLPSDQGAIQVIDELQDFALSAKHLAVAGAFNVNSTSVRAWQALLSGYRAAAVAYSTNANVNVDQLDSDVSAFPGMSLAAGNAISGSTNLANDAAWRGFMKLTDSDIEALAEAIVAQIKARADARGSSNGRTPALSLGQFINRMKPKSNSTARDFTQGGTIQQAIDVVGINDNLSGLPVDQFETTYFNQNHSPKPVGWGGNFREYYPDPNYSVDIRNVSPLALTQADILQALGPVLSARSDTFTIRSYGDVEDTVSGEVVSRAWCEATVQRTTNEEDSVNKPNQRVFKVVAFRWLSSEEI
jgi:hypothetical protein